MAGRKSSLEGDLLDAGNEQKMEYYLEPLHIRYEKHMAIAVVVAYIVMVICNVIASTVCGSGKDAVCKSNSDQSDHNPTYLTPDGATFGIWGIIYAFEAVFTIYQVWPASKGGGNGLESLREVRPYALAAWLLNGIWLLVFSFSLFWISLAVMYLYVYCIYKCYELLVVDYHASLDDSGNFIKWQHKLCCYPAFGLQLSWLIVAASVNTCLVGYNNEWLAPPDFAVFIIVVIMGINTVLSVSRADFCYAFVSVWALSGIVRKQEDPGDAWNQIIMPPSQQIIDWAQMAMWYISIVAGGKLIFAIVTRNNPHINYYFSPSRPSAQKRR